MKTTDNKMMNNEELGKVSGGSLAGGSLAGGLAEGSLADGTLAGGNLAIGVLAETMEVSIPPMNEFVKNEKKNKTCKETKASGAPAKAIGLFGGNTCAAGVSVKRGDLF